jgi:hypothetical protein
MLNWYDVCTGSLDYAAESANNPPVRSDVRNVRARRIQKYMLKALSNSCFQQCTE